MGANRGARTRPALEAGPTEHRSALRALAIVVNQVQADGALVVLAHPHPAEGEANVTRKASRCSVLIVMSDTVLLGFTSAHSIRAWQLKQTRDS